MAGMYVHVCVLRLLSKIFICFLTFHRKLEKPHFLSFSMILPLILWFSKRQRVCLGTLPHFTSPLKPCLLSCAECDLSSASEHTETPPSTMGNPVLGAFHTFCDVFALKVALLREAALWSCRQGRCRCALCLAEAAWAVGMVPTCSRHCCPGPTLVPGLGEPSCPSVLPSVPAWAALPECMAPLPAGIHTEPREFPICEIFLVLIII